jgi:hypothetical protein
VIRVGPIVHRSPNRAHRANDVSRAAPRARSWQGVRGALDANSVSAWLDSLDVLEPAPITHAAAERALAEARHELWGDA